MDSFFAFVSEIIVKGLKKHSLRFERCKIIVIRIIFLLLVKSNFIHKESVLNVFARYSLRIWQIGRGKRGKRRGIWNSCRLDFSREQQWRHIGHSGCLQTRTILQQHELERLETARNFFQLFLKGVFFALLFQNHYSLLFTDVFKRNALIYFRL